MRDRVKHGLMSCLTSISVRYRTIPQLTDESRVDNCLLAVTTHKTRSGSSLYLQHRLFLSMSVLFNNEISRTIR